MRARLALGLALLPALLGAGSQSNSPDHANRAQARSVVWPSTEVDDLHGRAATLSASSPRLRVVNVWARWCGPCRRELPSLQRLSGLVDRQRIEVLTLALDDDAFALREFVIGQKLDLPVWRARDGALRPMLGRGELPQTFVVGRDGQVLAHWVGAREWDAPAQRAAILALDRPDGGS